MNRKHFLASLSTIGLGSPVAAMTSFSDYDLQPYFFNELFFSEKHSKSDCVIIGGSFAGISAALSLARSLRKVTIIQKGAPRNVQALQSNNVIGNDRKSPIGILENFKRELEPYRKYIHFVDEEAIQIVKNETEFEVKTSSSDVYNSIYLLFATGVEDKLPQLDGLQQAWGKTVYHCPYCHGFESVGKKTVFLYQKPGDLSSLPFIQHWVGESNVYLAYLSEQSLSAEMESFLNKLGVKHFNEPVVSIQSKSHNDGLTLTFRSGKSEQFDLAYIKPENQKRTTLAESIGCKLDESKSIETDENMKTSLDKVYAIGDVSSKSTGQIMFASFSGYKAAIAIHNELLISEFRKRMS
jgi:thioredoxin reductase